MALTDASFLLFWVLAIGQGQRFLERPESRRAVALGLAVGVAQLFKYNGWIAGVIVAAARGPLARLASAERRSRQTAATWGWGLLAAIWSRPSSTGRGSRSSNRTAAMPRSWRISAAIWAASRSWPGHLAVQLGQARALSGGIGLACCRRARRGALAMTLTRVTRGSARDRCRGSSSRPLSLALLCLVPNLILVDSLVLAAGLLRAFGLDGRSQGCASCWVGWAITGGPHAVLSSVCAALAPARGVRLALPGGSVRRRCGRGLEIVESQGRDGRCDPSVVIRRLWLALLSPSGLASLGHLASGRSANGRLPGVLEPSDSLRRGLPVDRARPAHGRSESLRLLRAAAGHVLPGPIKPGRRRSPAEPEPAARAGGLRVVGPARHGDGPARRRSRCRAAPIGRPTGIVVREIPTTLNLPTLLDIDPSRPAERMPTLGVGCGYSARNGQGTR